MSKLVANYFWPVFCGLLIAAVIWLAVPEAFRSKTEKAEEKLSQVEQNVSFTNNQPYSYASAVNRAAPSVVNIYTSKTVTVYPQPFVDDPARRNLFSRLGTLRPATQELKNLGTGILVSREGYVLTNEHVISGADEILVALNDGRESAAQLIGVDRATDLAVLKISLTNLKAINIGDPNAAQVGDIVLAIGNAKGFNQTVSQGILSGKGRSLGDIDAGVNVNYLQTDAAINSGNSGGPLVDARGDMIGINTRTIVDDGSFGLSFAIPADTAMRVFRDILEYGEVIHGWLGVQADQYVLSDEAADALGIDSVFRVSRLDSRGPAFRAGLELGDVIFKIDGQPVTNIRRTSRTIANTPPGQKIEFEILRGQQTLFVTVQVERRPEPNQTFN